MADNLPLIPDKDGTVCGDVRPVLREVFRELGGLPPLALKKPDRENVGESGDCELPQVNQWVERYASECKEIWKREVELKNEHAKRISREPLPNIYKIYSPAAVKGNEAEWRREREMMIKRKDLVPTIVENAGRDESLWIKNILNRSSGDLTPIELQSSRLHQPIYLSSPTEDTLQSLSIGDVMVNPAAPPSFESPLPPEPEYILCVPPQLDFVNFTVGQSYTQSLRLVNVSKFEIRLSIRPPSRRELDIELCGVRGLTVTSGAAAELKVHFRPRDVRVLRDVLHVRVSVGKSFDVPIACYMQPPLLDISVPSVNSAALSYSLGNGNGCEEVSRSSDVLELGAKLLGDVHSAKLLLHCDAEHASFFILTEDAWISFCLDGLTTDGSVVSCGFAVCPAWWRGGGTVRGCAWCMASHSGLHAAKFRILCSTSVVRPLNIIADSLHFRPDHLTLVAQEKDYDICSEDDPDCEYFVHLGIAFPHRSLSTTIQLVNHSPVIYSYYWSVRPWGVCSCWEEERKLEGSFGPGDGEERLCVGALDAKEMSERGRADMSKGEEAGMVRVDPAHGQIAPRSSCELHVGVPNVCRELGLHRAVLMLILKDIPKESFPPDYDPMIVSTKTVKSETIPGMKVYLREVCEIVCCQLEVWWEVVPVRFVLDPCKLSLFHSRRVHSVDIAIRATQLFGCEPLRAAWVVPNGVSQIDPSRLTPSCSCAVMLHMPLRSLPNDYPETDVINLAAINGEWESRCLVTRQCTTRHPALRPARVWLGVVHPGNHMYASLDVINDTHQQICWWSEVFRWWGENVPSPACIGRPPCETCQEKVCSCALVRPARGALQHGDAAVIHYDVNAPEMDGCVATLVQVRRTSADVSQIPGEAGTQARATLVAYRVLAPRLVMRVLSCAGSKNGCCDDSGSADGCTLDRGVLRSKRGTATLRPLGALTLGRRTCYRLRFTNLTPLPASVRWDTPIESKEFLHVMFLPNQFDVMGYDEVDIRVVLEARKVCGRRIFLYRAQVAKAYKPLYLIIDTAVAGLDITCEIPIGDELNTDSFIVMRRTEREDYSWEAGMVRPSTPDEIFAYEDRKRAIVKENICHCKYEMVYILPKKPVQPPSKGPEDYSSIEIVLEPPPLTRVCPCATCLKPSLPEEIAPCCLQFRNLPMKTVRSRTVVLRNHSILTARWTTAIRRWPRLHNRTINTDQWAGDVRDPGVILQCTPSSGILASKALTRIDVQVYADCWGLFHDQILIKAMVETLESDLNWLQPTGSAHLDTEHVLTEDRRKIVSLELIVSHTIAHIEPIVLDVWIEAVGPPLQLAMKPTEVYLEASPIMWLSASDPERTLQVKNVSRTELDVQAYVFTEIEHLQDVKPFRLYLRFYDIPTRTCPCTNAYGDEVNGEKSSEHSSYTEEMKTWIEIYFAPDYGIQEDTCFKVSPEVKTVAAGAWTEWKVSLEPPLHYELASPCNLVLRAMPKNRSGEIWYRPDPPAQIVSLKQTERESHVKASCKELRVKLCVLDLPYKDVTRVRKRFRLLNIGNGYQALNACTQPPWRIVLNKEQHPICGVGCVCTEKDYVENVKREEFVPFYLDPRSSVEICVEVRVDTTELLPAEFDTAGPSTSPNYPEFKITKTPLRFYDDDNVLLKLSLVLELEYPRLMVEPKAIDFGFVTDGDTRKTYITVSHSSHNVSLEVTTEFVGGKEFKIWPPFLHLPPKATERIYVQYTSVWSGAPAEGYVQLCVERGSKLIPTWCRTVVPCRATPSRDHKCRFTRHDYTDDTHLLPPDLIL